MAFVCTRGLIGLGIASTAPRLCARRARQVEAAVSRNPWRRATMSTSSSVDVSTRIEELRGPEGIFSKILAKEIPADVVYEDDECLAFRDINPQAPTHVVVIPKRRIAMLQDATKDDKAILGQLMLAAAEVARIEKLDAGYRVLVNNGYDGLQSVGHIHLHVIGGRKLKWGPF